MKDVTLRAAGRPFVLMDQLSPLSLFQPEGLALLHSARWLSSRLQNQILYQLLLHAQHFSCRFIQFGDARLNRQVNALRQLDLFYVRFQTPALLVTVNRAFFD